ncbi:methylase [Streptococcus cuniculi]|uniref:site-specific DNA-methyltransferase (adenine-specific) n=1 Tax=Streptococcus cuniculi TaxID=1432788 RepID=A0A1Q8E7K9_9STRE|nr:methylase [Streptococcus cuniculi]OLF47750.1 methylase [Streptococcus cuniculi]
MEENLIKSKHRVQKHGEVFTPSWMVQKMLDTPGVKEACESIYTTFLEPSAGDGNFLQAILERKLDSVVRQYDKRNWKTKSLIAVSSIYGIEFLEDNLEVARSRMFLSYLEWYEKMFGIRLSSKMDIYKSAHYLIHKNIVRGNTLTQRHPLTNDLIWFNEWQLVKGHPSTVRKIPFAFAELVGEEVKYDSSSIGENQLSLFEFDDKESEQKEQIREINIQKIYLLGD